jgi:formamidopyrimidine-DNA glycosylase
MEVRIGMSIELPEAKILAEQMNKELHGKCIRSYCLQDYRRLQRIRFMNKDIKSFDQLVNRRIESATSRGNTIRLKLDGKLDLILSPEYGGEIFYHTNAATVPGKFHLRIDFSDKTALTVRLASMGGIHVLKDDQLMDSYMFKRDFNPEMLSPIGKTFTFNTFSRLLQENNRALKSVLVGKDAILVGVSNSGFQDIMYRSKLHPKRKASELGPAERRALFNAVKLVLYERIRLNGKDQFSDLFQRHGRYVPAMGPNMKGQRCRICKTSIVELSLGGGKVFVCPRCQA